MWIQQKAGSSPRSEFQSFLQYWVNVQKVCRYLLNSLCICSNSRQNSTVHPPKYSKITIFSWNCHSDVRYGRFVRLQRTEIFVCSRCTVHQWNPQLVGFPTRCRACSTDGIWPPVSLAVRACRNEGCIQPSRAACSPGSDKGTTTGSRSTGTNYYW